jgi:hypothetical protein
VVVSGRLNDRGGDLIMNQFDRRENSVVPDRPAALDDAPTTCADFTRPVGTNDRVNRRPPPGNDPLGRVRR